ncbi:RelA/SpoT domain-containing protein [Brevundimonas diminuta]|uniref:RelA/SpoT domain-containing protein n=1 Tax=Brevundimonas diminuta TaxID=293 RepID=UPI00209846CC|nr:RelA/SpoT domain-containing protein [Brevundimonas diminuta]MCO8020295.1 RelA/SpoT domain-containing protein [Brevundimonas diminuta]MCO8023273.1 RelA/SpoT domain-containing protein [Brevundimonas diminuta]
MNFAEYEKAGRQSYERLASTVAAILGVILAGMPTVRVQQIQHRAKGPASLKKKIEMAGGTLDDDVESHAKDVAGCRLILYTNDDVARLVRSYVMFDNFDIDWDRTKFHYPLDEHSSAGGFISYNYVVKLKEQRTSLPEYADLADLWCEIQVQTTIDHAWSEMHHDTVYKPPAKGFGGAVLKEVEKRMARIMQDYLVPAGFDFQKVSNDVRRLEDARTFFETRPLERVEADIDNNERHDILKRYRETVLPYVDDLTGQAQTIRDALSASLEKAATTETVPIYYGTYEHAGKTFEDVLEATLDIVDRLRFADEQGVRATWDLIGHAFDLASTEAARARAAGSAKSLGKHNLHVWKQVGPLIQCQLAELALADAEYPGRRALVIAAARAILNPEVEGTTNGSNTITIHQGAVLPSGELARAREQSISALEAMLTEPLPTDAKEAFSALMAATSFPYHGTVDVALVELIATNTLRVVDIASRLAPLAPPFWRASIERRMLDLYRQAGGLRPEHQQITKLVALRDQLKAELEAFRDAVNADQSYVTHKTLVGFEPVSRGEWDRTEWDLEAMRAERTAALDALVRGVTGESFGTLLAIILDVASVQSDDGATFISFDEFLQLLAEVHPAFGLQLITDHHAELAPFLRPLLAGLGQGPEAAAALALCTQWIAEGRHLTQILRFSAFAQPPNLPLFEAVASAALSGADTNEMLTLVEQASRLVDEYPQVIVTALLPSVRSLAAVTNHRWIDRLWFVWKEEYVSHFSETQIDELLDLSEEIPTVGTHAEWWLGAIAAVWPEKIVRWFETRIVRQRQREWGERFEAVPFRLSRLKPSLQTQGTAVLEMVRSAFDPADISFQYTGGKLLAEVLPDLGSVQAELKALASGNDDDRLFLTRIMAAYDGSPAIDGLCRDLVAATEPGSQTWTAVELAIDATGVVSGEFGMADASQARKTAMEAWLKDDREPVQQFARRHILSLDRQIASERRRTIEEVALRKREYGEA